MKVTAITNDDDKHLARIKSLLKVAVTDLKFNMGEAVAYQQSIEWFDYFVALVIKAKKRQEDLIKQKVKLAKEPPEAEGGLKIKNFQPGDLSDSTAESQPQ